MGTARRRVRVGLYVDPVAPVWVVRANLRLAQLCGADDVWLGDHTRAMLPGHIWDRASNPMARVVPDLDAFLDPTAVIARYARRGGPVIGTSVTDPFRRTPADLARAWMTLHHLTGGRAILGIGAGEVENTEPYGISYDRPVSRLEDTLAALRAAWEAPGGPVTDAGPFHRWSGATFALPLRGGTAPPVWVGAQGPRACRAAGRWGDGWISTHYGWDTWVSGAREVAAAAGRAGRDADELTRSLLVASVLVPDTAALARAVRLPIFLAAATALPAAGWEAAGVEHPLGASYRGPQDYTPEAVDAEVMRLAAERMTPGLFSSLMPCGTAGEVADRLSCFIESGVDHVVVLNLGPIAGARVGAASLVEQRRLVRLLKRRVPGPFAPGRPERPRS